MPGRKEPRQARRSRDRTTGTRPFRKRILIVCEGENTEPDYFDSIIRRHKLSNVTLADGRNLDVLIEGGRGNTLGLVRYAKKQQTTGSERYDEIWCVFDKDDFPDDDFDNAIRSCQETCEPDGLRWLQAAWSNQAVELWYVLHFEYLDTAAVRQQTANKVTARRYYMDRLNQLVPLVGIPQYAKSKGVSSILYERLGVDYLKTGIRNASRLLQTHLEEHGPVPPYPPYHQLIPATTVHQLVASLLAYAPEGSPLGPPLRQQDESSEPSGEESKNQQS